MQYPLQETPYPENESIISVQTNITMGRMAPLANEAEVPINIIRMSSLVANRNFKK